MNAITTSMRHAFENISVKKGTPLNSLAQRIVNALNTKAGTKALGKGWNASLSYKTYMKLKADGLAL
jgi:hypothetical protein